MATLVCFHAHPDDEAISTGGLMAQAAAAGHRVVLVVATRGEHGEPVAGILKTGEELADRRVAETHRSAVVLGVDRLHFLGYVDSGMMGTTTNDDPGCFWQASIEEAAERLAPLLRTEQAAVLTIYDEWGTYGHPDHIQVHRVGRRAAELAGMNPHQVFCATANRDRLQRLQELIPRDATAEGVSSDAADRLPDLETLGVPEEMITHAVDVAEFADRKRLAMEAHASQISPDDFFLRMPLDSFRQAFGTEWFVCLGAPRLPGEPFLSELFAPAPGPGPGRGDESK